MIYPYSTFHPKGQDLILDGYTPKSTTLSNGNTVLSWIELEDSGTDIKLQIFDLAGISI